MRGSDITVLVLLVQVVVVSQTVVVSCAHGAVGTMYMYNHLSTVAVNMKVHECRVFSD